MTTSASFKIIPDLPEPSSRPRFPPLPEGAFPSASLMTWLGWAQAAGVEAVPGAVVATLPVEALLHFDEPVEGTHEALAALDRANAERPDGHMLRWDCCAPLGIKGVMDGHNPAGGCPQAADLALFVDDPRAFDLLFEFPAETIAVVQRPWVQARMHDGFPIEFRVFVHEGRTVAVSNYYPQRDLPDTPEVRAWASQSIAATERIVGAVRQAGTFPWIAVPRNIPEAVLRGIEATLDFLVTEDGRVVFLEAGPGLGMGAHPCCFYNPKTQEVSKADGLRLAVAGPTHTLPMASNPLR